MKHSTLSPSSAHRWMICPGSVNQEEGEPDHTSEFAAEGTRAHALAHYMLDPIRATLAEPDDDDMQQHCTDYMKYVQALGGIQWYECRVSYGDWVEDGWGTSDAIVWDGETLHVIDLKYGRGVEVSPIDNEQGLLYALGSYHTWSLIYDIDKIEIHIVQPRLNRFRSWQLNAAQLLRFGERARQAALETLAPDAPLVPDEKACQFCRARHKCRALAENNLKVAQLDFGSVDDEVQTLPDPLALSIPEQAYIYRHKDIIKNMMTAMEQSLTRALNHGQDVPGFKLVEGRTLRKWTNPDDAEAALRKVKKLKVGQFMKTSLTSPAQVEKLLGKGHPLLDEQVTKPKGQATLVALEDKRPEILPAMLSDFKDEELIQ